jgi:6-phosphogluconate dehydrogenase
MPTADIGLIGLAVMGQNLVLNMARNGYRVAVYNRTTARMTEFVNAHAGVSVAGWETLPEFVADLKPPRKVMVMVQAGGAVDAVIEELVPLLDKGDLIIDGGNSHYTDSERRSRDVAAAGLEFMGIGVSGGEEGALWGPSIMPGGSRESWAGVEPILTAISAKAERDGQPCVAYIGPRGAGHYVKMVHNAIEYGDMQLIAEAYQILCDLGGLNNRELAATFGEWNAAELDSFLIDITATIFKTRDEETGNDLVDMVLDKAAQKGTGKWASQDALDLGAPIPTINAAVVGRIVSSFKDQRVTASRVLPGPATAPGDLDRTTLVEGVRAALYAAKISAYAQGMALLGLASDEYGYELNLGEVARIWRGGCIIRARFLDRITEAYERDPHLPNLMLDREFRAALAQRLPAWRTIVAEAVKAGIPVPGLSASLAYYDSYRSARLPANLIQAQRDLFGAHTYERTDRPGTFHSTWS